MPPWPTLGDPSVLRAPLEVTESVDRLVLAQGPSTLFRVAAVLLVLFGVFCAVAFVGMLLGSQTQRLTCDRAAGTCEMNGHALVPLADVSGVELRRQHTSGGRSESYTDYHVTLLLRDGTKKDASFQGARSDRSIAEYQAAVDATARFLADATAARLDTTFVYRASPGEYVRMGIFVGFLVPMLWFVLSLWVNVRVTFDRQAGTVTAVSRPLLASGRERQLRTADVTAIVDEQSLAGHPVRLELADGSRVTVLFTKEARTALVTQLREFTGKQGYESR
jgi:hypothetical protein